MNSYNVLLLSVGRRVELVNCFKQAAKKLKIESVIVGADCQSNAPALYFSDKSCILPKISSSSYIECIIDACNENNISLVVPTIDTELLLLAKNREVIENKTDAKVLISKLGIIEICRDKFRTQEFFESNNFKVPHLYSNHELGSSDETIYPLFIRPKNGSSSINAFKVNNKTELTAYIAIIMDPIVQDFVEGKEFTIDAFLDFDSNIITVVPRLRIETRSGEIIKGKIVKERQIIDECKRVLSILKPIGPITIQCILSASGIEFIEINPRFGGGAPMSITSGADSCENLFRLLMGEKLIYHEEFSDGLIFVRFDSSICINDKSFTKNCEIDQDKNSDLYGINE